MDFAFETRMNQRPPSVEDQLRALQHDYAQQLPSRAADLHERLGALADHWDAAQARELQRLAHNLAGSGASYGFPEISHAARKLEHTIEAALGAAGTGADALPAIRSALEKLDEAIGSIRRG